MAETVLEKASFETTQSYLNQAKFERLAILAEELAEAIQIVGKIMRHGYNSYHPEQ